MVKWSSRLEDMIEEGIWGVTNAKGLLQNPYGDFLLDMCLKYSHMRRVNEVFLQWWTKSQLDILHYQIKSPVQKMSNFCWNHWILSSLDLWLLQSNTNILFYSPELYSKTLVKNHHIHEIKNMEKFSCYSPWSFIPTDYRWMFLCILQHGKSKH